MANSADAKDEGLVFHPMDQFIVEPLFGAGPVHWYTVTNVTLWMALSVVALILIMVVGTSKRALVPSRAQSIGELACLLYTSPSPRDRPLSRMPSSA